MMDATMITGPTPETSGAGGQVVRLVSCGSILLPSERKFSRKESRGFLSDSLRETRLAGTVLFCMRPDLDSKTLRELNDGVKSIVTGNGTTFVRRYFLRAS
jgi:hypothetical protein